MKAPKHHRVLYTDANEDARLMIKVFLKISAIEVTTAGTIAEAWRLAQAEHFDLYLQDSRFPDGNGFDLCRSLREFAPHTPIIIYSGDAYETDKQRGLLAGASDYVTKPYLDDLDLIIRQTIEHQKKIRRKPNPAYVESSAIMCQP